MGEGTGSASPACTGPDREVSTVTAGKPDSSHIFTAFGSMWMTQYRTGQLLRLEIS
jgi:hypothetical protein